MAAIDVKWTSDNEDESKNNTSASNGGEAMPSLGAEPNTPAGSEPSRPSGVSFSRTAGVTQPSALAPSVPVPATPDASSEEPVKTEVTPPVADKPDPAVEAKEEEKPTEPTPAPKPVVAFSSGGAAPKGSKKHLLIEGLLVVLLVLLAAWSYMLVQQKADLQKKVDADEKQIAQLNNNPAIVEQRKTQELVAKVMKLTDLPAGERPQAAVVSDSAALKKQYSFFSSVQNGDDILFYYQAGKVIVYRPSTNKIVISGPLTISQQATNTTANKP
jgi:hypothetical protein